MKVITLLAVLIFSFTSFAADKKVNICHQSAPGMFIDLSVSIKAQAAFLRQGDELGTCLYNELLETCPEGVNETQDACISTPPPVDGGGGGFDDGGGELPYDEPEVDCSSDPNICA